MKKTRVNILAAAILVGALMTGCSAVVSQTDTAGFDSLVNTNEQTSVAAMSNDTDTSTENSSSSVNLKRASSDTESGTSKNSSTGTSGGTSENSSTGTSGSTSQNSGTGTSSGTSQNSGTSISGGTSQNSGTSSAEISSASTNGAAQSANDTASEESVTKATTSSDYTYTPVVTQISSSSGGVLDTSDMFTERDLTQTADLSDAKNVTVSDGKTIEITEAGVYVITGSAANCTIKVNADSEAKVQLVLDGVTITNDSAPAIYVLSADKCFVTTTESENTLSVTGQFTADGDVNTDAVIFSKDDLVLNGQGTLNISSTDNGISCKDDLKITGGTYNITSTANSIEANDSIRICAGSINITSGKDGLHSENDEDDTVGYIYISGGSLNIKAASDAVQGTTVVQIDGGSLDLNASEGIEGTYIQINDGDINIYASDDGINAAKKSSYSTPTIEFNGGNIKVEVGQGDTDAIDSNGNIIVNGGTIDVTAQMSSFDYDGTAQYNGGTIIINGTQTNSIPQSMMGGGMGGFGGQRMRGM